MNARRLPLLWFCSMLVFVLLLGALYFYGAKPVTILLALLALVCPVLIIWVYWRFGRESSALSGAPRNNAEAHRQGHQ